MIDTPQDANGRTRQGDSDGETSTAHSNAQASSDAEPNASKAPNPLEPLLEQIAAVRAYAQHYFEAQTDAARAAVRRTILKAAAGLGAAIVAVTFVIACTIMLAEGLAQLIGIVAGDRPWVGNIVLGGGVLLILAISVGFYVAQKLRTARELTIRKYENRHYAQRAKFGADVTQRKST
jgi:hypothetical protein